MHRRTVTKAPRISNTQMGALLRAFFSLYSFIASLADPRHSQLIAGLAKRFLEKTSRFCGYAFRRTISETNRTSPSMEISRHV